MGVAIWWATRPKPPVIIPPEVQARGDLESLRKLAEDGRVLSKVSQAVRRYFGAAFALPPGELTTAEFCRAMAANDQVGSELSTTTSDFLRRCDERKFAPDAPARGNGRRRLRFETGGASGASSGTVAAGRPGKIRIHCQIVSESFEFQYPWVLALLALLPVYALLVGRAGKFSALRFPSAEIARAAGRGRAGGRRAIPVVSPLAHGGLAHHYAGRAAVRERPHRDAGQRRGHHARAGFVVVHDGAGHGQARRKGVALRYRIVGAGGFHSPPPQRPPRA